MKKILLSLFAAALSVATVFAQAPEKMNYQGVARDNAGNVLPNQSVGLQIKLRSGSTGGAVVYQEAHSASTNAFGLFNVQIGGGTVQSGTFSSITWGSNTYYVEVLMDASGGTSYTSMGTQQLVSVPYALNAKSAANVSGTTNYVSKFTSGTTLGNSQIFDDGATVGIGTTGAGYNKLSVYGAASNAASGPHQSFLQTGSADPSMQLMNWNADDAAILFGSYLSTANDWTSSSSSSNFKIHKLTDGLHFDYYSGVAPGGTIGWSNGMIIKPNGSVGVGTTTPGYLFDVSASGFTQARLGGSSGSGGGTFRLDRLNTGANNYLAFTTADALSWTVGSVNTGNENFNLTNFNGSVVEVLRADATSNHILVNPAYAGGALTFSRFNVGDDASYGGVFRSAQSSGDALDAYIDATTGSIAYALYANCADARGYAGYFSGKVYVSGNFTVGGTKAFRIDHPLDPANKYLYHSSIESDYMMNLYNGVATTDASGVVTVQLPEWFGAVNKNFRYQLTCINEFAQAIISKEVNNNEFTIKTDKPNVKVSWQVTGERNDKNADYYRMSVEVNKNAEEAGYYQNPEVFGLSPEMAIDVHKHNEHQKAQEAELSNKQVAPVVNSKNGDPTKPGDDAVKVVAPAAKPVQGSAGSGIK